MWVVRFSLSHLPVFTAFNQSLLTSFATKYQAHSIQPIAFWMSLSNSP
jgi:hypothetical protein